MGRDTTACARVTANGRSSSKTPTAFPPILSEFDLYLLGEGTHMHLYERLGAHPMVLDGVSGVAFAVFAPAAKRVSVVGDFNLWDGRRHAMRVRGNGFWEIRARSPRRRQI
jgi:1,4-alpha-glucan branching enzyme